MGFPSIFKHNDIQKWFIYNCINEGFNVQKEVKIANHRADLLIEDKLIIEIQVTFLPYTDFEDRTLIYKKFAYKTIWVLSGDYYARASLSTISDTYNGIDELEKYIENKELLSQPYIYYYGEGWLWRAEINHSKYNPNYGWYNLKRCGFKTLIRKLLE